MGNIFLGYGIGFGYGLLQVKIFYFDVDGDGTRILVLLITEDPCHGEHHLTRILWCINGMLLIKLLLITRRLLHGLLQKMIITDSKSLNSYTNYLFMAGTISLHLKWDIHIQVIKGFCSTVQINKGLVNFGGSYNISGAAASINYLEIRVIQSIWNRL